MTHAVVTMAFALVASAGCHRPKSHEANVEVTRVQAVRKDEAGGPHAGLRVHTECPGTQIEVVRGDAKFSACTGKYKVGDKVKVSIQHVWSDQDVYQWTVTKVGDCERVSDAADEASYALVRECDDWEVNGARVGFQCKYTPEKKLIDKCPWFKRR
jgi:hypothetical protein